MNGREKKQVYNPYLPLNEYIPDGEPRNFEGRVYIYGSHDKENGERYCLLDYVCYSAPEEDLTDWRCEGVIYRRDQDPHHADDQYLYAPDVVRGPDGRYYLYYVLSEELEVAVAVSKGPAGPFEYYGRVHYPDGRILLENVPYDPGLLRDGDDTWLYFGFAPTFKMHKQFPEDLPGASVVKLSRDMLTVTDGPKVIMPPKEKAAGTEYEGHAFFEACSARKIGDWYFLIYDSENIHELCYAYSDRPDGGFHYGGTVISNADIGYKGRQPCQANNNISNNHGGLAHDAHGNWYIFYHRHTHGHQFSRQGCAEPVKIDGSSITQAEVTSCGLNGGPLEGKGTYPAAIACNLYGKPRGVGIPYMGRLKDQPYVTNEGSTYFVTNVNADAHLNFKYFDLEAPSRIQISLRGDRGVVLVRENDDLLAAVDFKGSDEFVSVCAPVQKQVTENACISLTYAGDGQVDIESFTFG